MASAVWNSRSKNQVRTNLIKVRLLVTTDLARRLRCGGVVNRERNPRGDLHGVVHAWCSPIWGRAFAAARSPGLAHGPVISIRAEEKRHNAVNECSVARYRKQAGRDAEAAGDYSCLAGVVGCAVG